MKKEYYLGWGAITFGFLGLLVSLALVSGNIQTRSQASPSFLPTEIKLANVTENSASVSWLTEKATVGSVVYSLNLDLNAEMTVGDDRGITTVSTLHQITLKNLKPGTNYYFQLISGDRAYDNGGKPYVLRTIQHTGVTPTAPFIIRGKLETEGLVYFSFNDSLPVSAFSDPSGRFLLTINNAVKKDLSGYYPVQKGEKGFLFFQLADDFWQQEVVVGEEMVIVPQKTAAVVKETPILPLPEPAARPSLFQKIKNFFLNLFNK